MHKINHLLVFLLAVFNVAEANSQTLAAYHDNQERFFIFDGGKTIQAEYLPVKSFSIGGNCILYINNRGNLKMYYKGSISDLEVGGVSQFVAMDYLSVYSIGDIVKIIENGQRDHHQHTCNKISGRGQSGSLF